MDRHCDGFQGAVTSRINEDSVRVQTQIEEVRRQKLEKVVSELLLLKPGGHVLSP
jgi:hypothetical protein